MFPVRHWGALSLTQDCEVVSLHKFMRLFSCVVKTLLLAAEVPERCSEEKMQRH